MEQINYRAAQEELVAYGKRLKAILSLSDLLEKGASLQDQVNELEKRKELSKELLVRIDTEVSIAEDKIRKIEITVQEMLQAAAIESKAIVEKGVEQARLEGDKLRTEAAKDVKALTARSNAILAELAQSEATLKSNAEKILVQEKTLEDLKDNLRKIKEKL